MTTGLTLGQPDSSALSVRFIASGYEFENDDAMGGENALVVVSENDDDILSQVALTQPDELTISDSRLSMDFFYGLPIVCPDLRSLSIRSLPDNTGPWPIDDILPPLASLKKLHTLEMRGIPEKLSNDAGSVIATFPALTTLVLWECRSLDDVFFAHLAKAPRLTTLRCDAVGVPAEGFVKLCREGRLKTLCFSAERVAPEHLLSIAQLANLEVLRIDGDGNDTFELTDETVAALLRALINLRSLTIRYVVKLKTAWLEQAASLKKLAHVKYRFHGSLSRDMIGGLLTSCPLETLNLSFNEIESDAFRDLASCETLKNLHLFSGSLPAEAVRDIAKAGSLRVLDLDCATVEAEADSIYKHLATMRHLRLLKLSHRFGLTDEQEESLRAQLPEVCVLS